MTVRVSAPAACVVLCAPSLRNAITYYLMDRMEEERGRGRGRAEDCVVYWEWEWRRRRREEDWGRPNQTEVFFINKKQGKL